MRRALAASLAVVWLGAALPARGDDVAEAKARFRRGVELFKERRWGEAMAEFEAAYRAKPHGAIHFNVAQCRERLEDWPGALRSYQDYLREVPEASDRAAVRKSILRIEERLAKAGVQVLLVYSDPPGARVTLEGLERGRTPLEVVLQPGAYALGIDLQGYGRWSEKVTVAPAASALVDVVLKPLPRAVASPVVPLPPPPDLTARPRPVPMGGGDRVPISTRAPSAFRRHLPAWIAAGTAVVAVAAGAWFGASARSDARALDRLPVDDPSAGSLARSAQSKARAANVLYGIAGGAAAVGATLYVIEERF